MRLVYVLLFIALGTPGLALAKGTNEVTEYRPEPRPMYRKMSLERIIDGDTFIASGVRIRLWGIDTPEKQEPGYRESAVALQLFIEEGELACKDIEIDRFNRQVMHCLIGQADLGGLMVKAGFANDYKKYSRGFYQKEEEFAREGGLGIWENRPNEE